MTSLDIKPPTFDIFDPRGIVFHWKIRAPSKLSFVPKATPTLFVCPPTVRNQIANIQHKFWMKQMHTGKNDHFETSLDELQELVHPGPLAAVHSVADPLELHMENKIGVSHVGGVC